MNEIIDMFGNTIREGDYVLYPSSGQFTIKRVSKISKRNIILEWYYQPTEYSLEKREYINVGEPNRYIKNVSRLKKNSLLRIDVGHVILFDKSILDWPERKYNE